MTGETPSVAPPSRQAGQRERHGAAESNPGGPLREARREPLLHVEALAEPVMVFLGFVSLALFVVEYAGLSLTPVEQGVANRAIALIYAAFVIDFLVRFTIAPSKLPFLRREWLLVLTLAIPFLRPFRVFRVVNALPSPHLLRALTGANRGLRALRRSARGRHVPFPIRRSKAGRAARRRPGPTRQIQASVGLSGRAPAIARKWRFIDRHRPSFPRGPLVALTHRGARVQWSREVGEGTIQTANRSRGNRAHAPAPRPGGSVSRARIL